MWAGLAFWAFPSGINSLLCCFQQPDKRQLMWCWAEEVRAVVASFCWQCPAGHLSRWWCLFVQYQTSTTTSHCAFPVGNLLLISSCWRLPCSPREGPTALRWTWLGWAGTVPCWGLWLPFLRDVPSFLPFLCLVVMPGGGWEELGGGCEECSRGCSHTDTLQACKRGDARQHQTGCGSGEGRDLGFFSFILKADLHSNAIWCFEGNNFVCPNLWCCFRKMIVLLINSWYKTSVVFRSRKLIMRSEAESSSEPHTEWCIWLN